MRSGFSIVKNGDSLGYPYLEALRSLAPPVDELVVAHGDSSDGTLGSLEKLAHDLPCPLRIIDSPWDPQNTRGGSELSRQTNIALAACQNEVCVYIQGDELYPERDFELIREDLERFEHDPKVDALAFRWVHFYGNFRTIVHSRRWYRREMRAIKRSRGLRSYGDAQGFRIPQPGGGWKKPRAALSRGRVFHYGWVRPPVVMAQKSEVLDRLWHGNARDGSHHAESAYVAQYGLREFKEAHPKLMLERVEALGDFDPFRDQTTPRNLDYWRMATTDLIERATGWRPGEFKNYASLKKY
jgi:hypothetical protein